MQPFGTSALGSTSITSPPATGDNHNSPSDISASSPAVPADQAKDLAGAKTREPSFLTIREAADVLRVSESTIRNAIGSGQLLAFRFGARGGSIRIGRADLEDYMASRATVARPAGRADGPPDGGLFKSLDASRLLASWRRQGVLDGRQG